MLQSIASSVVVIHGSKGSALACYSGGVWYRKKVTLSPQQVGGRVVLDLGSVVATAEVRVGGQSAGFW